MDKREIVLADRVAAFGLDPPGAKPLFVSSSEWPAFNSRISLQRLTGLAVAAVEAGQLELDPAHEAELRRRQISAMLQALVLERRLLDLADSFDSAAVDLVVLKGPVLANEVYPDPALRPFLDIDILVRGTQRSAASAVLLQEGFARMLPEPRPGFDERFGKAALHMDDAGIQLDLHRRLAPGPFGLWLEPDELIEQSVPFSLGGRLLWRLDDTALLMHACVHAALGSDPPRRLALRDVVEVSRRCDVDWGRFVELCSRWRLAAVVKRSAALVEDVLGIAVEPLQDAGDGMHATRAESQALSAYLGRGRQRGRLALHTLNAIPSVSAKVAYLGALLVPRREFLSARASDGSASYLRRWRVPLRWARRPRSDQRRPQVIGSEGA